MNYREVNVDIKSGGDYLAQEVTPSGKTILQVPNKAGAIISSKGCGDWEKV